MTITQFKKYIRKWQHSKDPIEILYPLDKLELLPPEKKWKTHAIDPRSFMEDGFCQVYPIAIDRHQVYIVCPWCREIHVHGNDHGRYNGHRSPHCKNYVPRNPGYVIRELE